MIYPEIRTLLPFSFFLFSFFFGYIFFFFFLRICRLTLSGFFKLLLLYIMMYFAVLIRLVGVLPCFLVWHSSNLHTFS